MAQISTAFQWQGISTLESSSILVCKMQPHALRACFSNPPKDLDDPAVNTATHAPPTAV